MAARPPSGDVGSLLTVLDDALALLGEYPVANALTTVGENPASLLDQCLELCADRDAGGPEPVRTLHHLACSGGSLISKCLAVMPNTQLLSEVDPLSPIQATYLRGEPHFSPTDMINLARQGSRGIEDGVVLAMFHADLEVLLEDCRRRGRRLVLRDHAHGHFTDGAAVPPRPSLRSIVATRFPVLSAVTVRHPLDSYLSLRSNGWVGFQPGTLDEYSRRYLAFLEAHAGVPRIRYEDFLADPPARMRELCAYLDLPYNPDFASLFDAIRVTGDSGRGGSVIEPRSRRTVGDDILAEAADAPDYRRLLRLLAYND